MDLKSILSPPSDEKNPRSSSTSQLPTPLPLADSVDATTPAALPPASSTPAKFSDRAPPGQVPPSARTKHAVAGSPLAQSPLTSLPSHVLGPLAPPSSSPLISPVPATPGTPHGVHRSHSTQSMDTLADLASMQSPQPMRPGPLKGSSLESIKSLGTVVQASLTSNPRASFDINMLDTRQLARRTDFDSTDLPPEKKDRLSALATHLTENPSAYDSHLALITLLHEAFIEYVFPTTDAGGLLPRQDPASFDLLPDLREARQTMQQLFAVGEATWLDWLQDESMLARTTEDRIDVIEKFRKAVSEEAGSCKLWAAYGDWVLECYQWANLAASSEDIDEEKLVGKEVFTSHMVMEVWQDAVDTTKLDIAHSHLVWNKFISLRIAEFQTNVSKDEATKILGLFEQRLRVPHVESDSTKQILSAFMTDHFSQDQYFEIMEDTARIMKDAVKALEERTSFEGRLEGAASSGDRDAEYKALTSYIDWEKTPAKRKRLDFDVCNALYQRAELRFPSDAALWDDHVAFTLENGRLSLDLLSRACKHCPWAGSLWSQYLLASDRQGQSYEDTEAIKHKATSTGVLEAAGISEVLKIHAAWCSYLRRRAFRPDADEDDSDIAEIGMRASMENISSLGAKLGIAGAADPTFRLQRIYTNFLSESGRWDHARREFDNAVSEYATSYQFWMRFYFWEMKRWRRFATKDPDDEPLASNSTPNLATAVLKQALDQEHLDYPEPIIETLLNHCEDYEDADEMQACLLKVRKVEKSLSARRQIEYLQSAELQAASQSNDVVTEDKRVRPSLAKRKRSFDESEETLYEDAKRGRTDEETAATVEQTQLEQPKRDREHATILIQNLPENISDVRLRQFFSSCGVVKALKMLDAGSSATIEFDDDKAARYALSRDGQQLDESIISVALDTGSTVFLTNYKPETNETEIRNLLEPYGQIISVRFPSLQGNKKRRFCYVQYMLPREAQDAVNGLNGKDVDGLSLTCQISDPAAKKQRQELSVNDGQTIFIGALNFKVKEDEIKRAFEQFGKIELIRMPLHETMKNRNKGIAFITFSSVEEAKAALQMHGQSLHDRQLRVHLAQDNDTQSRVSGRHSSAPPSQLNGMGKAASPSNFTEPRSDRTIFITAVPDTVNEAQIRQAGMKHGEVVKVVLKTNHQGALIEFASVSDAGKASLALEGHEIVPGRFLKVVSEEELKAQSPEKKAGESFKTEVVWANVTTIPGSGFVKRPAQPGVKSRKGGNLGQKSTILQVRQVSHEKSKGPNGNPDSPQDNSASAKKSNADFRALVTGGTKNSDRSEAEE